jgi:hypothetical protein
MLALTRIKTVYEIVLRSRRKKLHGQKLNKSNDIYILMKNVNYQ